MAKNSSQRFASSDSTGSGAPSSRGARSGNARRPLGQGRRPRQGTHSQPIGSAGATRGRSQRNGRPASQGVRLEPQTVGQIRRESDRRAAAAERRERSKKRMRKARIPFIIGGVVVFLVIAAVVAYFVLMNSRTFEIKEIEISGTDHLTKQEISALVSIPQGTTLLDVDSDAIAASLERDAWIESVDVNRIFPDKIEVVIHERSITAVVEVPVGQTQEIQNWALSNDGVWLMAIPDRNSELGSQISEQIYSDAESVLHIVDVKYGIDPQIGAHCSDSEILNALEIISSMTTSLSEKVKVVSAPDIESTMLVLDSNVEIAFGAAKDMRDKERICLQIMKENPKVVYINVRVPDRPTWRSA